MKPLCDRKLQHLKRGRKKHLIFGISFFYFYKTNTLLIKTIFCYDFNA